jgi:hypothetical protein
MTRRFFYKITIRMQWNDSERATYSSFHLLDKITRVSIESVCLLDRDDRCFRFGRRVKDLIAEEIEGGQDDTQDKDKGVGGNGKRHGRRRRGVEMVRFQEKTIGPGI